ncbi:MAG: S26 family signal peptidase [Planctomycetota bacterium]|jgi:hypothetical protein
MGEHDERVGMSGGDESAQSPPAQLGRRRITLRSVLLYVVSPIILALVVRAFLLQVNHVTSDAIAPAVPRGGYILVYKLASRFEDGDIVLYRRNRVGTVKAVDKENAALVVARRGEDDETVPLADVKGRVILNTR